MWPCLVTCCVARATEGGRNPCLHLLLFPLFSSGMGGWDDAKKKRRRRVPFVLLVWRASKGQGCQGQMSPEFCCFSVYYCIILKKDRIFLQKTMLVLMFFKGPARVLASGHDWNCHYFHLCVCPFRGERGNAQNRCRRPLFLPCPQQSSIFLFYCICAVPV